jgi:lysophospholipase L1-like esterase
MTALSRPRRLLLAAAVLFGTPLAAELVLRATGFRFPPPDPLFAMWSEDIDAEMQREDALHRTAAGTLWEPRPGAVVPSTEDERINGAGYRGPLRPVERTPGVLRVLTLGDSSTFGMNVPYEQCYSSRLEELLTKSGHPTEVLNGGVIGYTVCQGAERWQQFRDYDPDVVVLAFGAVNEHFPASGPHDLAKVAASRAGDRPLARLAAWARRELRLVQALARLRIEVRGGLEADRRARFDAWQRLQEASSAEGHWRGAVDWPGVRRVSPDEFEQLLTALVGDVRAAGAVPVLISMPRQRLFEKPNPIARVYTERVERVAAATGAALLDARAGFQTGDPTVPEPLQLYLDFFHPSDMGHWGIARALVPLVAEAAGWNELAERR